MHGRRASHDVDVETGLILSKDGIMDALEREYLPEKYRFVYENSRRPPPIHQTAGARRKMEMVACLESDA